MLDRFYRAEGEQPDLFPEATKSGGFWRFLPAIVIGAMLIMVSAAALAQEGKAVVLTKALMCNSVEEVKAQTDIFSSSDVASIQPTMIEGCGWLTRPVPAVVTPIGEYQNKHVKILIGSIQIPDMPIQYGYIAYEPVTGEEV